ncbi:MAG: hypothetical protein LBU32_05535 [Clostridiales bacterium]|jgi:hypothetical protein|nr:hypothetical protein [Clostridiales bacterium]
MKLGKRYNPGTGEPVLTCGGGSGARLWKSRLQKLGAKPVHEDHRLALPSRNLKTERHGAQPVF